VTALVTASEAAQTVRLAGGSCTAATVRKWASRGQIKARGERADGAKLYDLAEVRKIVERNGRLVTPPCGTLALSAVPDTKG